MLGLDPEGPIPLDIIGGLPADFADRQWRAHSTPLPISGDPFFRRSVPSTKENDSD